MRLAAALLAVLVASFVVGRWWWAAAPAEPSVAQSSGLQEGAPLSPPSSVRSPPSIARLAHRSTPAPSPALYVRTDEEVLERMMMQHRQAMFLLSEAAQYELRERLASCGEYVGGNATCWIRFRCALHGQLMELQFEDVECAPPATDAGLWSCVRDRAALREPLGIPSAASSELGDYEGPLEMSWYVR